MPTSGRCTGSGRRGQGIAEYGTILCLMALAVISSLLFLADGAVLKVWTEVENSVPKPTAPATPPVTPPGA